LARVLIDMIRWYVYAKSPVIVIVKRTTVIDPI